MSDLEYLLSWSKLVAVGILTGLEERTSCDGLQGDFDCRLRKDIEVLFY